MEEGASMKDIDEKSLSIFIEDSKEKGRMPETKACLLSDFGKTATYEGRKLKRLQLCYW